ncbi:hypothetical protein CEP53_001891 [Fusarium sp. AF-6]|nr:hypothetical protein CEP53_001891 [Fusarium sp. AF-6]
MRFAVQGQLKGTFRYGLRPGALQLSDDQRCQKEATHANDIFCGFHSKQVFALYKGYKRRNALLDTLDNDAPEYLKNAQQPLANDEFEAIDDKKTLREVHSHFFAKYVLLGNVIDARKLHHKHFYSLNVDYGHQAYIDKLIILYQKEQWFSWVREVQEEEEANDEKEQKKVKQEAALFKRHVKKLEGRLAKMRQKEEQKRQDAYLEDAYRERMAMAAEEDDEAWDPIEDMEHLKRNRYIDLIKHFLWLKTMEEEEEDLPPLEEIPPLEPSPPPEPQKPSKKAKKKAKAKAAKAGGQGRLLAALKEGRYPTPTELPEPDRNDIETEEEMRNRLSHGVKKNYDNVWGFQIVGTMENSYETHEKTAPMTNDEIESTVSDIRQIKHLLFCRLLLGQASMLAAALHANSVAESDLRDLCLEVEEPTLQDIRDACADFARGDSAEEEEDADEAAEEEDEDDETFEELVNGDRRYKNLHTDDWLLEKFLGKLEKKNPSKKKKKKKQKSKKKTKFSVMAKDCDLKHAIQLCRNWAEFSDLNLLTLWQYFPASNWSAWGNNRLIQQLQELGFFPYFVDLEAQKHSRHNQIGGRSSSRRQHDIVETRNIIVGHMKRNDPITRRFLQYLSMRTGELLVMVRDGKTGRVITAPPEEQLWTYRIKQGLGRASKNEWRNVLEVGPLYFDMTDMLREWRFGFDDYYDVFIWDFVPCQSSLDMYNVAITELRNAWRIKHPRDVYQHMKPLLTTMTREKDTMRTRLIKPDEKRQVPHRRTAGSFAIHVYNDVNVLEDQILFPDELVSDKKNVPFREIRNGVSRIEDGILPSTIRHLEKGMEAFTEGKDPMKALKAVKDRDDNSIWAIPKVWETGLKQARKETLSDAQRSLLKRTGLSTPQKTM